MTYTRKEIPKMITNPFEYQYLDVLQDLISNGIEKQDRTNTGMREIFGTTQMVFDLNTGLFPLLTTKKMFTKGIIVELLWFLRGDTNIQYLLDHNVNIWNAWADEHGNLGPVYGSQWRSWPNLPDHIDQIENLVQEIKTNPYSRRMMVSSWNPSQIQDMRLPPCHCLFQCNVQPLSHQRRLSWASYSLQNPNLDPNSLDDLNIPTHELHLKLYQRSADWFLGVPFNIASYSLLLRMLAHVTGNAPGRFIHSFGSAHLYNNHIPQAHIQLNRQPLPPPTLNLDQNIKNINNFSLDSFSFQDYQSHPTIKADIAV